MTTTVARKYVIEIRDSDDKLVCILDNAHTIVYTEAINEAPRLSFSLPADDDKAVNITKANEICLRNYEAGTVINKFKLSFRGDVRQRTLITTVNAEGFIGQLADELVTSYTAADKTITQIVTALLAFQVLTPAITVGTIDPTVTRSISVTGDTILRALYRLRDTVGGHIYVDSNRALQWKTSIGEDKGQQIRYQKNLKGIARDIDYRTLANRLYAYGAGEGDARIKLSDVEGQDEDYIEDTGSQTEWGGIYRKHIVDKSITHPDTLLAWAQLRLAELKNPRITYRVDTVDLSESIEVDFSFEALQVGSTIKVIDEDLSINVSAQVVKITHPDLLHPELMEIEVANRVKDISDSLAEVYDIQQLAQHIATMIGAGQVVVLGAFTVKDWVTGGETTIVGSNIETGTITALQLSAGEIITLSAQIKNGIITSAKIVSLEAGKITAGTITGQEIILSGAASIFKSSDYVEGEAGWQIKGDGVAEFNEVTIRGTIYATAGEFTGTLKATTIEAGKTLTVNGTISAGAGAVVLDSDGIKLKGEVLWFYDENGVYRGVIFATPTQVRLATLAGFPLVLNAAEVIFDAPIVRPFTHLVTDLGASDKYLNKAYTNELFVNKVYVATELHIPSEAA